MNRLFTFACACLVSFSLGASWVRAEVPPITVFAAASLKDVLEEAGHSFTASGGPEVRFSFASSGTLAKQIENGAPADLFASADLQWMDYLGDKKLIDTASRVELLGNTLVVVAPASSSLSTLDFTAESFTKALGNGRLATGEIHSVPVGIYAKAALEKLGLWPVVEPRLAQTDNVRAALLFASRGEVPLAIVYATDAAIDPGVKLVARFPEESHEPIRYPFALTSHATGEGPARFLAFLKSPNAKAIFERYGFPVLVP
jgi:molybdate transport system substrate-binding protein